MNWRATLAAVVISTAATAAFTYAQDNGGGGQGGGRRNNGGQGGGGGGGGNFDPAQFQQRMMERFKTDLKAQDDEWKVIEPKLTKVLEAQREARAGGGRGGFGGGGGRQGGGGGGGNQPTTELGTAAQELRTALENESSSADDIDKKLTAFRNAREKANTNLAATRKDLKEVLTARQEATLVVNGILE